MSMNLNVPVRDPLETRLILEGTTKALAELLRTPSIPTLQAKMWHENSPVPPPLLWKPTGLMTLSLEGNHPITVMVLDFSDDPLEEESEATSVADVTVQGAGGDPVRMVLAAACAAAIAREANSVICDDAQEWGSCSESAPEGFLDKLGCRRQHDSLEAAFEEVLGNIEEAKRK